MEDGKGIGVNSRLTIAKCDVIQNFYGGAIRDNKDNPEAILKSVWAILKNYSNTPAEPKHEYCPKGEKSWSSFQRDLCTVGVTYQPTKYPFSQAVVNAMAPLFKRLAAPSFLEACKNYHTQNASESFNHLVWILEPKGQFVSSRKTSFGINLAVCIFNDGWSVTLERIFQANEFTVEPVSLQVWKKIADDRIRQGDYKMREEQKIKRKQKKRLACKKEDAFQRSEGVHNAAQKFHKT